MSTGGAGGGRRGSKGVEGSRRRSNGSRRGPKGAEGGRRGGEGEAKGVEGGRRGAEGEAKRSRRGGEGEGKGRRKGSKGSRRGGEGEAKGAEGGPKGSRRGAKGGRRGGEGSRRGSKGRRRGSRWGALRRAPPHLSGALRLAARRVPAGHAALGAAHVRHLPGAQRRGQLHRVHLPALRVTGGRGAVGGGETGNGGRPRWCGGGWGSGCLTWGEAVGHGVLFGVVAMGDPRVDGLGFPILTGFGVMVVGRLWGRSASMGTGSQWWMGLGSQRPHMGQLWGRAQLVAARGWWSGGFGAVVVGRLWGSGSPFEATGTGSQRWMGLGSQRPTCGAVMGQGSARCRWGAAGCGEGDARGGWGLGCPT